MERRIYLGDKQAGAARTRGQRVATALARRAERSAAKPKRARAARPLFTVHVGEASLAHLCELGNGRVVAPGTLLPHVGRAELWTVLFDGPSTVGAVSQNRLFTGALRRAIVARDRRCQHPSGCDVAADDCGIDHIEPHSQDGETGQFNGRVQCRPHNRDPARHDHGGVPPPGRDGTVLDEIRARLRWRLLHGELHPGGGDDHDQGGDRVA